MDAPSLETLKARLDGHWVAELLGASPPHGMEWDWVGFKVPSNQNSSVIDSMVLSCCWLCESSMRVCFPHFHK